MIGWLEKNPEIITVLAISLVIGIVFIIVIKKYEARKKALKKHGKTS